MSEISIEATRCPNCTSSLIDVDAKDYLSREDSHFCKW